MFLAHLNKSTSTATVERVPANNPSPAEPVNRIKKQKPPAGSVIVSTRTDNAGAGSVVADIIRAEPVPVVVNAVPVVPFNEYPPGSFESVETLKPLRGFGRTGDAVHNTQTMDARFRNVSTGWTDRANDPNDTRVLTWDSAFELVERERGQTRDIFSEFGKLQVVNDAQGVAVLDERGQRLTFTESSLDQFSDWVECGLTLPRRLLRGDDQDRRTLVDVFNNGLRRIADKKALIRLRNDGTARAFLSDQYCVLDNRWFLEVLRRLIPDGLVSHFRSPDNCDSVFFNVLIPDSMRAETDSLYGGMLACGNGETGERKLSTCPSVFRAICMNGCIWDEVRGTGIIKKVHRGQIKLDELAELIRENLDRQIPLLGNGIDSMMRTRAISAELSPVPAIGAVLRSLSIAGITRAAADSIVDSYGNQRTEPARVSAFDILQGLTHAAQTFSPGLQETVERAAGSAMLWNVDRWENVFSSARTISAVELERVFNNAV